MQDVENSSADQPSDAEKPTSKKRARSAKQMSDQTERGIGDNSRLAGIDRDGGGEKNVQITTFSDAHVAAEKAIAGFLEGSQTFQESTITALDALYMLVWSVFQAGAVAEFCAAHGIDQHGNTENPTQPIVAHYLRGGGKEVKRQTVSRWSAILEVVRASHTKPQDFREWVKHCGMENLYRQYQSPRRTANSIEKVREEKRLARTVLPDPALVPVTTGTNLTKGEEEGLRLAVIEITDVGRGDYRLLMVLEDSPHDVTQRLASIARKRRK
jgi:hypothetical protein